jgi:hypothetical protein
MARFTEYTGPIRVSVVVFDDLQNTGSSEAP